MKNVLLALALVLSVITAACSGGTPTSPSANPAPPSGGGTPGNPGSQTVTVTVFEEISEIPISGASVTISGKSAMTGPDGRATFEDLSPNEYAVVSIEKSGYLGPRMTKFGTSGRFGLIPDRAPADAPFLGQLIFNGSSRLGRVVSDVVHLYITPELQSQTVLDAYRRGADAVSAATSGQVRFEVTTSEPSSGVVFRVQMGPPRPGVGAGTTYTTDRGNILRGVIEYPLREYASNWEIARHEIGHAIGLNHNSQSGVMHATGGYGVPDFTSGEKAAMRFLFTRSPSTIFPDDDRQASNTLALRGSETTSLVCYFRP